MGNSGKVSKENHLPLRAGFNPTYRQIFRGNYAITVRFWQVLHKELVVGVVQTIGNVVVLGEIQPDFLRISLAD